MKRESQPVRGASIEERIEIAEVLFECFGKYLRRKYLNLIERLDRAIDETWRYMRSVGITETCRMCALETGSCCWRWVEDLYDVPTLIVNLLLGVEFPKERYDERLCFFCGEKGCRIRAREGICVTYLCDKIEISRVEFNRVASKELGYLSYLKVRIGRFLDQRVPRSSSGIGFWRSHHHDFEVLPNYHESELLE